ncbi:MAG: DUF4364 family protein [Clostridia bacterium]|nr:DUF4364 family protein [Clostridia bacterium]
MPAFIKGEERNKLIILVLNQAFDIELTSEQIYRAVFEGSYMSYFDFQNAMYELEEDGWITAIPRPVGQVYRITPAGEAALASLIDTVPAAIRNEISEYAKRNRDDLQEETRFPNSMEELSDGTYMVRLAAVDGNRTEMKVEMHVQTREIAQNMRNNWRKNAYGVFTHLFGVLSAKEEHTSSADS